MYKHKTAITVRYAETDRMGVVYHSDYLVWFEVARTDYFKFRGISYRDLEEKKGLFLMVVEIQCKYKQPVTYDDEVIVESWISGLKNTSLKFQYRLTSEGTHIADGLSTHVFTDRGGKPTKMPSNIREALT